MNEHYFKGEEGVYYNYFDDMIYILLNKTYHIDVTTGQPFPFFIYDVDRGDKKFEGVMITNLDKTSIRIGFEVFLTFSKA